MDLKFKNDKQFEESIVQAMILDHPFSEQMIEVLNIDYFNVEFLKEITKVLFSHYHKYKSFPSYKLLGSIILNEVPDGLVKDQMKAYWIKIRTAPLKGDLEYVKETALDFCRKRSLAIALETSLSLIEEKQYEQVSTEIKKALQAGAERSVGHEYNSNLERRIREDVYENILSTPWAEFNKILRCGGLPGGKVGVIAAGTGIGKSHFLVNIGSCGIMAGKTGVHYTLEDSDIDTGRRYDANISGIALDNLSSNKDVVREKLANVKGSLIIKSYPAGTASILTLKNHLNHLLMRGIRPDFILIDYAELLKSSQDHDAKRFNIEEVFRDLVAWSQEINLPIWTAAQLNRASMDVEVVTNKHLHECFAVSQIVHIFVTMNRDKTGPQPDIGNVFICKSKVSSDGIKFPMMINTGMSKLELLPPGSDDDSGDTDEDNEQGELHRLREKFKKFKQKFSSNKQTNSFN
jgi:replicative DNA helicase